MRLLESLHNEIDEIEDLQDDAHKIIADVKKKLTNIAKGCDTFEELLDNIVIIVANNITEITTRAALVGIRHAARRRLLES